MSSKGNFARKLVFALTIVCMAATLFVLLRRPAPQLPVAAPDVPRREMVQRDGRWYRTGQASPFSGCMVDYYHGGGPLSRSQISNGLLNGVSEAWYTNGQMQVREHFKDGVSHGLREKWYENGTRLSLATIVDAKVTGTFRSWHDNGQLSEQIEMKLGRPDGVAFAYYHSGFLKAETTMHDGQVQERKVWNDGERKNTP